jgi:hypothetical protein
VTKNARGERRKTKREMHVDRRKSDMDVIEHVIRGVRRTHDRPTKDDCPARLRLKN